MVRVCEARRFTPAGLIILGIAVFAALALVEIAGSMQLPKKHWPLVVGAQSIVEWATSDSAAIHGGV